MDTKRKGRNLSIGVATLVLTALFAVFPAAAFGQTTVSQLLVSTSADRSGAVALEGQTVEGNIYVFTLPNSGVKQVKFYLDDPNRTKTPIMTEGKAPWDFAGTETNVAFAKPYDSSQLADGVHTITAAVLFTNGTTEVITSSFTVGDPTLEFAPSELSVTAGEGDEPVTHAVTLRLRPPA